MRGDVDQHEQDDEVGERNQPFGHYVHAQQTVDSTCDINWSAPDETPWLSCMRAPRRRPRGAGPDHVAGAGGDPCIEDAVRAVAAGGIVETCDHRRLRCIAAAVVQQYGTESSRRALIIASENHPAAGQQSHL